MYLSVKGLVLREALYKDSSRILTVLSDTEGKITVSARGAKRKNSKIASASQLFAYSDMTLFGRQGRWYLSEASTIELFRGLRLDLTRLALGEYFLELLDAVCGEDMANPELLKLGLNGLFALAGTLYSPENVKAAFELRLMCLSGFAPALDCCAHCGESELGAVKLDLSGGTLLCGACSRGTEKQELCRDSLAALRFVANSADNRIFSFMIRGDAQRRMSAACERYAAAQLERGFRTLDFYHNLDK